MKNKIKNNNEKIYLEKLEFLNKNPDPLSADEYMADVSELNNRLAELEASIEAGAKDSEILKLQEEILNFIKIAK